MRDRSLTIGVCMLTLLLGALAGKFALAADVGNVEAKATSAEVPKPTAPAEPKDMKPMFDGKTLDGWDGDPRLWSVKDGMIRGQTTKENAAKGNTFLVWKGGEPGDFEMRVTFRLDPEKTGEGNSGVQYRSHVLPSSDKRATNNWVMSGYQAEIANVPGKDGFLYHEKGPSERHREDKQNPPLYLDIVGDKVEIDADGLSHVVGSVGDRAAIGSTLHKSDWNDYVIIARGNHLQHFINGVQTIDAVDNDPKGVLKSGSIGFQIHAGQPMTVEFKNPRIKIYDEEK